MKVVSRDGLLLCARGTIFSYYKPAIVSGLWQLGPRTMNDFYVRDLLAQVDTNTSPDEFKPALDMAWQREGRFDAEQQYVVYEVLDLAEIVSKMLVAARECAADGPQYLMSQAMMGSLNFVDDDEFPEPGSEAG